MSRLPKCRFCKASIPKAVREHALRSGQEPRFCGFKNHRQLWSKRRRQLVARGFEGAKLDREMNRLAEQARMQRLNPSIPRKLASRKRPKALAADPVDPGSARPAETAPQGPEWAAKVTWTPEKDSEPAIEPVQLRNPPRRQTIPPNVPIHEAEAVLEVLEMTVDEAKARFPEAFTPAGILASLDGKK